MRKGLVLVCVALLAGASSAEPAGKLRVCRDSRIVSLADKSRVKVQAPVHFMRPGGPTYDGDTDAWIEIQDDFSIGPKPSCLTLTGVLTRNAKNAPGPKKGSVWRASATAYPDQWVGQKPVEKEITVDGVRGLALEGSGTEIKSVELQAIPLADFR